MMHQYCSATGRVWDVLLTRNHAGGPRVGAHFNNLHLTTESIGDSFVSSTDRGPEGTDIEAAMLPAPAPQPQLTRRQHSAFSYSHEVCIEREREREKERESVEGSSGRERSHSTE